MSSAGIIDLTYISSLAGVNLAEDFYTKRLMILVVKSVFLISLLACDYLTLIVLH